MTIQEFGDAFKAQIDKRKADMDLDDAVDAATFYTPGHNYAGGESQLIDEFFNAGLGTSNSLLTDAELRNAPDAGDDKGDASGNEEDWRNINDAEAGRILGQIFELGVNDDQIKLDGNNIKVDDPDGNALIGSQTIINFFTTYNGKVAFRTAFKAVVAAAPDTDIDPYFDKGLDGAQAAALYNATPRIAATELKADKSGTVEYNGKDYDVKVAANIALLNNAKVAVNTEIRNELNTLLPSLGTAFTDTVAAQWTNPSNKKINTKEEIKKLLETVIEEKNGVKKVKGDFITAITPRGVTSLETLITSKETKEVITAIKKYEYDHLLSGEEMGQKGQEDRQIRKVLNKPTGDLTAAEVEETLYKFANGDEHRTNNPLDANLQEITTGGGDKSKSFMDYLAMGYYAPVWVSLLAIAGVIYKWESIKGWWNSSDEEDSEENNKEE